MRGARTEREGGLQVIERCSIAGRRACLSRTVFGAAVTGLCALTLLAACLAPSASAQSMRIDDAVLVRLAKPYGDGALERLRAWQRLMADHLDTQEASKRRVTNDFFNRIPWLSDDEHWGKRDYWATPVEMLGSNGGDCEDYSVAKFFTLKELDIPEDKLLITYVRATQLNQPHMVLAYYPKPNAEPLILDNLNGQILPASKRRDLIPVYSFNGGGLWRGIERTRGKSAGSAKRIAGWRTMLRRMDLELGG